MFFLLKIFGIERADRFKHILVKHTADGDLYFRVCLNGVPDFTLDKSQAWKFKTPQDAAEARRNLGVFYRGMSIIEVEPNTTAPK